MDAFDLDQFFPYRLAVLSAKVSKGFAEEYGKEFGISQAEWRVIVHLAMAGKVSIREVYQRVDMDKSKVSRAATRLEAAGVILKKVNPQDKRLVELSLTAKGKRMMNRLAPMAREYEARVLAVLSPEQRAALDDIFDTLLEAK